MAIYMVEQSEYMRFAEERQKEEIRRDAAILQSEVENEIQRGSIEAAIRLLSLENHHPDAFAALLLDESRTVVAANRIRWVGIPMEHLLKDLPALRQAGLEPRIAAARRTSPGWTYVEPGTSWLVTLQAAQTLRTAGASLRGRRDGLFVLVRDIGLHHRRAHVQARAQAAELAIILFVLVLLLASFFRARVTTRLGAMAGVMKRFGEGELSARCGADASGDEIGDAVRGLNSMMDRVVAEWRGRGLVEETLRASEERFRRIFEEAGTGLVLVGGDDAIQRANAAFASFLGKEQDELQGLKWDGLQADALSGSESLLLLDLKAGRIGSVHMERRFRHASGRYVWGDLSVTQLGSASAPSGLIIQVQDVTARREAQRALDEAMELNRKIIAAASHGIVAFRGDGTCIFANESAARIFGEPGESLLGRSIRHWPSWSDAGLTAAGEDVLRKGQAARIASVTYRNGGRSLSLDCRLGTFQRGGEAHLLVLAEDATERRQAEAALVAAARQASIGQLAAGVAHEFNNILAVMKSQFAALQDTPGCSSSPEATAILATLDAQASRGAVIVRGLHALARPAPPSKEVLLVEVLFRDLLSIQRRQLAEENIAIGHDPGTGLAVNADPGQVQQVLLNLVLNARQALRGREHPRLLQLRAAPEGTMIRIEVEDNGRGMDPGTLDRLTEPFFTTRGAEGTGLGLLVCQKIVVQHGGELTFRNRPGEGMTVAFTLPAADPARGKQDREPGAQPATNSSAQDRSESSSIRLLIVDDEEALAQGLAVYLRQRGYMAEACTDAASAARAVSTQVYDLAILDQTMPGLSGLALAAKIRRRCPSAILFLMTGHLDREGIEREASEAGVRSVLQKPFDLGDLLAAIREALADRAARREPTAL